MSNDTGFHLDNSYARLPEALFARCPPTPVARPRTLLLNGVLATELGLDLDILASPDGTAVLAGNQLPEGSDPLAQAYAGHQFGNPTMLGDGRAVLLGEQVTANGQRRDIQLKGGGRTPFSRGGDGRAALGPMLREYLISEAMHALGIATTRSLAVVASGEEVHRESVLPGAVLTRVAASHVRVGTFQYAAGQRDKALLETLLDYVLERHYPVLLHADNKALALLDAVMDRQIELVVGWMRVGFIHGVLNTDNVTLSGETIDYGPCAFLDAYNPQKVFSSIDQRGRYAFGNQPMITRWNLARFAETLLTLIDTDSDTAVKKAEALLNEFTGRYETQWLAMMRQKLGLFSPGDGGDGGGGGGGGGGQIDADQDAKLIADLLDWMQHQEADYTRTFRDLIGGERPAAEIYQDPAFGDWHQRWRARLAHNRKPDAAAWCLMRHTNPAIIPRNHQVERALHAAVMEGNRQPAVALLDAFANPYRDRATDDPYTQPPQPDEEVTATFCGT